MIVLMLMLASYPVLGLCGGTRLHICCQKTRMPDCESSCRKLLSPPQKFKALRKELTSLVKDCPPSEPQFWGCIHDSELLKDLRSRTKKHRNRRYYGVCCKEAKQTSCEVDCLTIKNISDLLHKETCNANREPNLTKCIKKIYAAKKCCGGSKKKPACKHSCMEFFKNSHSGLVLGKKKELEDNCGRNSKQFQCAIDQSQVDQMTNDIVSCCDVAHNHKCRSLCRKNFRNPSDFSKALSSLKDTCGDVSMDTPIFECLARVSSRKSGRSVSIQRKEYPSLSFKKLCCNRAKSRECAKWCHDTFNGDELNLWGTMYLSCIENPQEIELYNCFNDILEPCEIGLKEPMGFCSNLNDRPMDLFRHGDRFGDTKADRIHKLFSDGVISVFDHKLAFKDISTCKPEMFKAMSCLLAIKPCDHRYPQKQICRRDCEMLMYECLDYERSMPMLKKPNAIPELCALIFPNSNQSNCIPLTYYTERNSLETLENKKVERQQVTLPCRDSPCAKDEVCMINHECLEQQNSIGSCKNYKCVKGCSVDDRSNLVIPIGQLAKLLSSVRSEKDCYQVCKCKLFNPSSSYPMFGDCEEFGCNKKKNCTFGKVNYRDGDVFSNQCNTCICTDGELDCTNRNCDFVNTKDNTVGRPRRYHDLDNNMMPNSPCSCHNIYKPVCALNGMTYPNSCLAKCGNVEDKELNVGDCQAVNPCDLNPCARDYECVPKRSVCLATFKLPASTCQQFRCVRKTSYTRIISPRESCSTRRRKHIGQVCGFDGVTYINECNAEDAGTGIDYYGPCLPTNLQNTNVHHDRCKNIKCKHIDGDVCDLTIPPGACCPKCGSTMRFLYSRKDVETHMNLINSSNPITVKDIVYSIRQLLRVAECKVHGHLTVENDLLFIMLVDSHKPTRVQAYACKTEAERFYKYIRNESPLIKTNYYLSFLKASKLKTSVIQKQTPSNSLRLSSHRDSKMLVVCLISAMLLLFVGSR